MILLGLPYGEEILHVHEQPFEIIIMNTIRHSCVYYGLAPKAKKAKGFTLLEVLVALVVLSIGMLGIAALLLATEKSNSSSYTKQQAIQSAYDMLDRMRANQTQALLGAYNASNIGGGAAAAPPVNCNAGPCTPAQMTAYDIWHWQNALQNQLPSGCGSVTTQASGAANMLVTVTVQWNDASANQMMGASTTNAAVGSSLAQYTIQTLI